MVTVPPRVPSLIVAVGDRGPRKLYLRLQKILVSTVTIAATAWCVTLGPLPAILACAIAKHVLVAVLVMGYDVAETPA